MREFSGTKPGDTLELFRSHFFLFHILYRLKDLLAERQEYHLSIHCLEIKLSPYRKAGDQSQPAAVDPLRSYYLDLKNMEEMDAEALTVMLDRFWQRFFSRDDCRAALEVLGLPEGSSLQTIKKRYRQLARESHPDTGGEPERFREVQQAMETLALWF